MKHFIDFKDLGADTLTDLLDLADQLKQEQKAGTAGQPLRGKSLGMIFAKSSTRTRVSFEVGMYQLGGQALFLNPQDIQLGRGETIADTARVLSRYLDAIMIRTFDHQDVLDLARFGTIPIINGLTDLMHPCQALADLQTIREVFGRLEGLKIAYLGDGNNMAHSLAQAAMKAGMHMAIATPPGYACREDILAAAARDVTGLGQLTTGQDPIDAVRDAHVVYTDTWISMGQEAEKEARLKIFETYQVNTEKMKQARPNAIFLHCLPAYRGFEVSDTVLDGPQSKVIDQAENRLHAQKAVLVRLLAAQSA